jgi:hypothetical protein
MPCPGSIALCEKVPSPPTSEYAKEGTAAHKVAEMCLEQFPMQEAREYLSFVLEVEGTKFTVDEEMADAVQVYLDAIREDLNTCSKSFQMNLEKRFDLTWICNDLFGTNDCSIYDPETKLLRIYDYKHGAGTSVDVEWNPQLMIYALGAVFDAWDFTEGLSVDQSVGHVEIVIVQPRMEHPEGYVRRWVIATESLLYWAAAVLKPAALRTADPDAKLFAGKHCKFCDAGAVCPEKAKQACALAKTDFAKPIFPAPEHMTSEQIADIIEKVPMFENWAKQVQVYAFGQAQRGVKIPGYKLVAKKSNRKWVDDGSGVVKILGEAAYNRKVISPAQAEKIIKKNGGSPEAELEGLWKKPDTGLTLVPESDRRTEIAASPAQDFIEDADFLQ